MGETKRLTFGGVKGVGNIDLTLAKHERAYVFIGTNGVGKTKCLEAIFQFYLFCNHDFHSFHKKRTHSGYVSKFSVVQSVDIDGFNGLKLPQDEHYRIADVVNENNLSHALPVVYLGASLRSLIDTSQARAELIRDFDDRRNRHFENINAALGVGRLDSLGMQTAIADWFVMRAQSANPYQKSSENRKVEIDVLLQALHRFDERIDPAFMQIDGSTVSLQIDGVVTELAHLSSGFASMLKMIQAIVSGYANFTNETNLTHVRGMVMIDEIESHLHTEWQSRIVPTLKTIFPNTTFYIATHSPIVLSQLKEGEAYQLKRDDDGVVRGRLIENPNKKIFSDMLEDAFDVDLNKLKRERMEVEDQTQAKAALLALIGDVGELD